MKGRWLPSGEVRSGRALTGPGPPRLASQRRRALISSFTMSHSQLPLRQSAPTHMPFRVVGTDSSSQNGNADDRRSINTEQAGLLRPTEGGTARAGNEVEVTLSQSALRCTNVTQQDRGRGSLPLTVSLGVPHSDHVSYHP